MRILLLDTNQLDFVGNDADYQKILEVLERPYSVGVHRVTF
jgi:hypothetical protein